MNASGEVVRIRPWVVVRALRLAGWVPLLGFNLALLARAGLGTGWRVFGVFALGLTLVVLLTRFLPDGVELRPDALVVRGLFKPNVVAWRDVAGVRVDRYGRLVVLERPHGQSVTLVYPGRGLLVLDQQHVEREYGRIVEWWLAHRAPDWRPVPPPPSPHPPPRPAR